MVVYCDPKDATNDEHIYKTVVEETALISTQFFYHYPVECNGFYLCAYVCFYSFRRNSDLYFANWLFHVEIQNLGKS